MTSVKNLPSKKPKPAAAFYEVVAASLVLALLVILLGFRVHHLKAEVADTQKQLSQAKAESAQAQTALDQAKASSGDLQGQLDQAKRQQADLQAQVDLGKAAAIQTAAQFDKAKTQASDLQVQVDKAASQSTSLQAQLAAATSGSSQLLTELDQAKIQSLDFQTRLQKAESDIAQLQPMLLKARRLPVTTALEKVQGGRSFTLHVNNLYLEPVTMEITISGVDKSRSQSNIVGSGATLDVEKLAAGEKVVIASQGYDPVNLTVE